MIGQRSDVLRRAFPGELLLPGDDGYEEGRIVWNAIVDRRPAAIARCRSASEVAAALRLSREAGLEVGVRSGGHSVLGFAIPDGGLTIDLTPMSDVRIDPDRRRAWVGGGSLLRNLDRSAESFGLATTAGNVSHTGVGGLTLGGGMGWLARQFGLACDNVEAYTVVTADGETVRASATEEPDLFWALRGGGGNFGIVTEFEFRLHPSTGRALVVELWFDEAHAAAALRAWRDHLPEAPRPAMLTADALVAGEPPFLSPELHGRPVVVIGYVWVGDLEEARRWLPAIRSVGSAAAEVVTEMSYVELQSIGDERHHPGLRRYSSDHYLTELTDEAIDAFLSRGRDRAGGATGDDESGASWRFAVAGFQAYGGAIADVGNDDSAFSHRDASVEFFAGATWADAADDEARISATRAWSRAVEPFASGAYVNALADQGDAAVRRAYTPEKLARLTNLKDRFDPDNVFHLNQNIPPSAARPGTTSPSRPSP